MDRAQAICSTVNHPPTPTLQIYELYNGGSVPVTYEVQVSVLSQVQEKNFDHPIFCCLNPKGEIQPGTTTRILWIFSPIEAKTYTVSSERPRYYWGGGGWSWSCDFLDAS